MLMTLYMDHIALNVSDEKKMLEFYSEILELTTERVQEFQAGSVPFPSIRINDHTIIDLFPKKMWWQEGINKEGYQNMNHFCLNVPKDTWLKLLERLKSHSIAIEIGPVNRWGAKGNGTSIYFRDPESNLIEVKYYEE
jgi:extradiol dioxygenase family protein